MRVTRILSSFGFVVLLSAPAISYAAPPTCHIAVAPFLIASNSFATLSWRTSNADNVTISGMGQVNSNGSTMVRSSYDKDYFLYAQGKEGSCQHSASLTVRSPYDTYGYFTPTVQTIVYPLVGYTQPQYGYNEPKYYSSYSYSYYNDYDDYYDWDDYYYFDKYYYDPYFEKMDAYYDSQIGYDPYYNDCGWEGCGGGGTYYYNYE